MDEKIEICTECNGRGYIKTENCNMCAGSGRQLVITSDKVRMPFYPDNFEKVYSEESKEKIEKMRRLR